MKKRKPDLVKENKERITYVLFYFFVASFLFKTVLGITAGSKCLLVSGIFALFGILIAVATLMRIGLAHSHRQLAGRRSAEYFNRGKLEFMILLGISAIITLSTSALLFSIGHMAFFHTLYPPELLAAWIAAVAAALNLCFRAVVKPRMADVQEGEARDIIFILDTDFMLSALTVFAVVISRMGSYVVDYACAIFAAFFIIAYSVSFLYVAFKGLMDASCDKETVATIEECIRRAGPGDASLEMLRVNKIGHVHEIMAVLNVVRDMPIPEATAIVKNIKNAVRAGFLKPHEVFVGIRQPVEK